MKKISWMYPKSNKKEINVSTISLAQTISGNFILPPENEIQLTSFKKQSEFDPHIVLQIEHPAEDSTIADTEIKVRLMEMCGIDDYRADCLIRMVKAKGPMSKVEYESLPEQYKQIELNPGVGFNRAYIYYFMKKYGSSCTKILVGVPATIGVILTQKAAIKRARGETYDANIISSPAAILLMSVTALGTIELVREVLVTHAGAKIELQIEKNKMFLTYYCGYLSGKYSRKDIIDKINTSITDNPLRRG